MCDTLARTDGNRTWFAKNSDREPGEPQRVERHEAASTVRAHTTQCTYIAVPTAARRLATILCRPDWCWGAEMGVNEAGVAIGNEAIFSRRRSLRPALLGMDLLRLALERGDSAASARDWICELLERYGQGGPAGYRDKRFCYDNSFIIADRHAVFVLETAGRDWVWKAAPAAAISNQLTLGDDYDAASNGIPAGTNFSRRFDGRAIPWLAGAGARHATSLACLAQPLGAARIANHLRSHYRDNEDPADGSNRDICMHAAGPIRRSQTTNSLIAHLTPEGPRLAVTGTSAPCLSIFRPVAFDGSWKALSRTGRDTAKGPPLWERHECLHRAALSDAPLRQEIRNSRTALEGSLFEHLDATGPELPADTLEGLDRAAEQWLEELHGHAATVSARRLPRYWRSVA